MVTTRSYPDRLEIRPAERPVDAVVQLPGSKSLTNRALVLAALADGTSVLEGALLSEDSLVMVESLRRLGISVEVDETSERMIVDGQGGAIPAKGAELFVGNSGTTARFLTAVVALGHGDYVVDGVPRMRERPIEPSSMHCGSWVWTPSRWLAPDVRRCGCEHAGLRAAPSGCAGMFQASTSARS